MTGNALLRARSLFPVARRPLARRIAGLAVLGAAIAVGMSAGFTVSRHWDWAATAGATAAIPLGVFIGGWERRGRAPAFSLPFSGSSVILGIAVLGFVALLARNAVLRRRGLPPVDAGRWRIASLPHLWIAAPVVVILLQAGVGALNLMNPLLGLRA